jgi:site-specific DNA-methyltransferase (adenine-specific)
MSDATNRTRTATSAFGVSRREGHDASAFYSRFELPEISDDDEVVISPVQDALVHGDSRDLTFLPDKSVALVVTSPPYFVGKEYEADVSKGHVPSTYLEYLAMLGDVFAECLRVLEPGGRIAVNVANLGRKPYRSLSRDVASILEDDLKMFGLGEILWVKAEGTGSCAWGSFCQASAPTLRDLTERILVFGKGGPKRALHWKAREELGLPHESTITKGDFMAATLDVWKIRPESARRVGHPAPFPVELPRRLIELYTFRSDLVVDPFAGVMSSGLAAVATDRRFVGVDTDLGYLRHGLARFDAEYPGHGIRIRRPSRRRGLAAA